MTAIADIIVNQSNPANLQLSQNIKDSLNTSSTTSFADMVSFYKDTSAQETGSEQKSETPVTKTESENQTAETSDEKSVSEKSENKKVEEKIEQKSEEKVSVENDKSDKKSVNNSAAAEKKVEADKVEAKDTKNKKAKTSIEADKKSEIKSEENIESDNLKYFEDYTASLMNNQKTEKVESKEIKISNEENVEIIPENTVSVEPQITEIQKSEDMDFSDLTKKDSGKKELKLDKEGKITVEDLRTEKVETSEKNEPKLKTQLKVTSENTATMTMNYAEETVQSDVLSLNDQTAGANGSNFQAMLNNQIQSNVPEFVKAGNIVLKDNNQGTINLILHPDDLGNVKIHLSLDGKTLTGHITVATKEALQVFKDNSETLREAFIKNGFDAANFEVSYGNGGNGNQNFGFEQRNDGTNLFGKQMYGSVAEGVMSEEKTEFSGIEEHFGNYSVNIVA